MNGLMSFSIIDVGSLIVAIIAIAISIWSNIKANKSEVENKNLREKYNELQEEQSKVAQGEAESTIRTMITHASERLQDLEMKSDIEKSTPAYVAAVRSADENYRNAYEEACARYLDGKVDTVRFRKMYHDEIRQLVEDKTEKVYYASNQSPYTSTLKVYKEWYREE